jgi:hypothetical protein
VSEKQAKPGFTRTTISITAIAGIILLATRILLAPVQSIRSNLDSLTWFRHSEVSEHVHAVSACIFFALAMGAVLAKKGSESHRLFGKIAIGALLIACLSASALLLLISIEAPGNSYHSIVMINENSGILLLLLMSGLYGGLSGYRWAALAQDKLDLDWAFGVFALMTALLGFALFPVVAFMKPLTSSNIGFPLTPLAAGVMLIGQSTLMLYFAVNDFQGCNQDVKSPSDRLDRHAFRVMLAAGAGFTAIFIVHLGPLIATNAALVPLLYIVPPGFFGAFTLLLRQRFQASRAPT